MTAVPFPVLSAPGRKPQSAGGRLINCFPEKLSGTAGEQYVYWRVPGLKSFGTAASKRTIADRCLSAARSMRCMAARPIRSVRQAARVLPSPGRFQGLLRLSWRATMRPRLTLQSSLRAMVLCRSHLARCRHGLMLMLASLMGDVPQGLFVFTYGDGKTRTSGVNSTSINTLDVATAESKPDTLYRPMPLGNGQLLLVGSASTEVWGGQVNDTGYPFGYIATIPRGIVGPYAITGDQDGWGKGIYAVGDDLKSIAARWLSVHADLAC